MRCKDRKHRGNASVLDWDDFVFLASASVPTTLQSNWTGVRTQEKGRFAKYFKIETKAQVERRAEVGQIKQPAEEV